jgi:hypothetical protein
MSSPASNQASGTTLPPEVVELALAGQRIDAVKLLRERTGMGLREAKDAVDAVAAGVTPRLQNDGGAVNDGLSRVPQYAIIAMVVIAALYFFFPALRSGQ